MNRLFGLCFVLATITATACSDDNCSSEDGCSSSGGAGGGGMLEPLGGVPPQGGEAVGGSGEGTAAGGAGGEGGGPAAATVAIVTVTEYFGGPGIAFDVISNAPDGTLADVGVTGVDGTVDIEVPVGGSVSLAYTNVYDEYDPPYTQHNLETIFFDGAAPDEIGFTAFLVHEEAEIEETMTQGFVFPEKPGAASYSLTTSCYNGSATPSVYVNDEAKGCTTDDVYDVLLLARDAGGAMVDHARLDDLVFTAGGSSLHGMAWANQPIDTIAFEVVNVPTIAQKVYVSTYAAELHEGRGPSASSQASLDDPSNEFGAVLQHLAQYGNQHCEHASVQIADDSSGRSNVGKSRCSASADLSTFEFDVSRLARFETLLNEDSPLVVSWVEAWPGDQGDLLTLYGAWQRVAGEEEGIWHGYMTPEATVAPFPQLPAALAKYGYLTGDTLYETSAYHEDFDEVDEFAQVVSMGLPRSVALEGEYNYQGIYP